MGFSMARSAIMLRYIRAFFLMVAYMRTGMLYMRSESPVLFAHGKASGTHSQSPPPPRSI
jgi:hypothetical protein